MKPDAFFEDFHRNFIIYENPLQQQPTLLHGSDYPVRKNLDT
jgi:hypothetical protein